MILRPVGEIIMDRRKEVEMTKSELTRRLGCSPQNIDSLETRKSIDFELAVKINTIMDFDIFTFYQVRPSKEVREFVELQRKYIALLHSVFSLSDNPKIRKPDVR